MDSGFRVCRGLGFRVLGVGELIWGLNKEP